MRRFYHWLFDYSGPMKFKTKLSVEEIVRRLKNITQKDTLLIMWLSAVSSLQFIGKVSEKRIVLYRARPWVNLYYNPYFFGKFSQEGDQVVLDGKFTMSKYVKILISFGLIFLCVFLGIMLLIVIIKPDSSEYSRLELLAMMMGAPLMMFLVIGMIQLVKKVTKKDVEWISAAISKELKA